MQRIEYQIITNFTSSESLWKRVLYTHKITTEGERPE